MMHRFTDSARSAIRSAFRHQAAASEPDLIAALAAERRGLAGILLGNAGIVAGDLAAGTASIDSYGFGDLRCVWRQRRASAGSPIARPPELPGQKRHERHERHGLIA